MKMKVKKYRLISVFLVFVLLASTIPMTFAAESENIELQAVPLAEKYTEALELLSMLGIYTTDETAKITADTEITRGEFTKRLIMTMNLSDVAKSVSDKKVFMDIHDETIEGYVNLAYDMGITKGAGDAQFEPDESATVQMATSMIMRALGYIYIDNEWDLITKAMRIGILDNVESKTYITAADTALILFNALHTGALSVTVMGEATHEMTAERDWLELYYNICYVEGIVTATEITGLKQNKPVREGNILVNDTEIFNVPDGSEALLGYPVRCYYENNEPYNIYRYMTSYGFDMQEIRLDSSELVSISTSSASYFDKKDRKKSKMINSSADFIYNGKAESLGKHTLDEMKKDFTSIKLLDNNDDNHIDVVFIEKAITFAVKSVDINRMRIIGKDSQLVEIQNDPNDLYSILWSNGTAASINDIKEWNIVSVTTNFDSDYVKVIISNDSVTGKAESYQKGGTCYLTVDGQEYEIIESLLDNNEIRTGKVATFYLGADGVIYDVNYGSDGSGKWVWAVAFESTNSLESNYKFGCVEGSQAEFKLYEVADRIVVDGSSVKEKNLETALTGVAFPEAMIIWTNEAGELTRINTLNLGSKESIDENIYKRHNGPESETVANDGTLWFNGGSNSFQGRFIISTDSVNYAFPTYDKSAYQDMFAIRYKHDEPPYAVTLYSQGTDSPVCDFSIALNLSKGGSLPGSETGAVPFVDIRKQYDVESGEVFDVLKYLNTANAEVTVKIPEDIMNVEMVYSNKNLDFDEDGTDDYIAYSKMPISWILSRLEEGDLIRLTTDQNGLAGIQHVFDISKRQLVQKQGAYCWTTATDGGSDEQRLFTGKLYEIYDNYLSIITNEENYDPVTGVGMEVHKIKANRSQGWNRMLTINTKGKVSFENISGIPALAGIKSGCDDIEVVMQSMFGDALFKIFIDYSNSPY